MTINHDSIDGNVPHNMCGLTMMILRDDIVITQQLAYIHKVIYTRNNEQLMVGVTEGYM